MLRTASGRQEPRAEKQMDISCYSQSPRQNSKSAKDQVSLSGGPNQRPSRLRKQNSADKDAGPKHGRICKAEAERSPKPAFRPTKRPSRGTISSQDHQARQPRRMRHESAAGYGGKYS